MNTNYYDAPGHRKAPRKTKRQLKTEFGLGNPGSGGFPETRRVRLVSKKDMARIRKAKWEATKKKFTMRPGAPVGPKKSFFQKIVSFFQKVVSFFKGGRA